MLRTEVPRAQHPWADRIRSRRWERRLHWQLWRKRRFGAAPTHERLLEGRLEFDQVGAMMGPPTGAVITDVDADGVSAQWLDFRNGHGGPVIFYVHGGAYAMGSIVASRHAAANHARRAGALCLVVQYRLSPEHPWPAGLDDVERAWHWLLRHHEAQDIVALGESAGGGMLIALLTRLRDTGSGLPAAAVTVSAWADLGLAAASYRQRRRRDLALDVRLLQLAADAYLDGADPSDPDVSPVHADLHGLPPLLLAVGTEEVVWDDTQTIARRAEDAGVEVEVLVGRRQIHCWPGYAETVLAAREASERIASFIDERCRQASP